MILLEIFVAVAFGAIVSTIGFFLFSWALSLSGPILYVAWDGWATCIAPVIGGIIGAAISCGLAIKGVYIVALSALVGGIAVSLLEVINAKARITPKGIRGSIIGGIGLGTINGILLAISFKALALTVGIDWLLAG